MLYFLYMDDEDFLPSVVDDEDEEDLPADPNTALYEQQVKNKITADLESFKKFQELNSKTQMEALLIEKDASKETIVEEDLKLVNHLGMNIILSLSQVRSVTDVARMNNEIAKFIKLRRNVLGMSLAPKIDDNGDDWSTPL